MVCVFVPFLLAVLLTEPSATLSSPAGAEQATLCPHGWLLFGQRCFAFFPVWSSWSTADSMCSQTGGNLASLHLPEERKFVHQLSVTDIPVWLGGYHTQQNDSWFWSDGSPLRISGWTNQRLENTTTEDSCMQIEPKSGQLQGAPCGELRFYICSTDASTQVESSKPVEPGIVPGVSLYDVTWAYSKSVAEEILHSSSFLKELWSDHLTQTCYARFMQQEMLYLQKVSITLEALVNTLQEADVMRPLLMETLTHYKNYRNQSMPTTSPPLWLRFSLQSFHSVVLEEPVYWLVALAARACLRSFLFEEQLLPEPRTGNPLLYWERWREESLKEVAWTQRYRKLIEEHQDQMDTFKAINIFREHMMNQKSFYKAVDCDVGEDR